MQRFFDRVIEFLEFIKSNYKNKNILLVTHAGVTKVCKCYFEGFLKDEEISAYLPNNAEALKYEI